MCNVADEPFCRICYSEINPITNRNDLISPCECNGSVKHVHHTCLKMWRMKGKAFGDMKTCEQCKCHYKIPGEKTVYSFFISLTSIASLFLMYCISASIFKNFCLAITSVIEELAYIMVSDHFTVYQGFYRDYHLSCCMLFMSFYHISKDPKALLILSYAISYASITVYESLFAKFAFTCISLYIFKGMYSDTFDIIDGLYYYLLNVNWEKSQNFECQALSLN